MCPDEMADRTGAAVVGIDVDHDEIADVAGADGDVAGPAQPPPLDLPDVGGGGEQAACDAGVLAR
ncbi:MAG: hypothetical protein R2755_26480 [Acidimicrobiales bacterium]